MLVLPIQDKNTGEHWLVKLEVSESPLGITLSVNIAIDLPNPEFMRLYGADVGKSADLNTTEKTKVAFNEALAKVNNRLNDRFGEGAIPVSGIELIEFWLKTKKVQIENNALKLVE